MTKKGITRRELFSGIPKVAGLGAVGAAIATSTVAAISLSGCGEEDNSKAPDSLKLLEDDVITLDAFAEIKDIKGLYKESKVCTINSSAIPQSSDGIGACAVCVNSNLKYATNITLINLATGKSKVALKAAVSSKDNYEILDAKCSATFMAWVESEFSSGKWRVYGCSVDIDNFTIGTPSVIEEDDENYDPPEIAVVESRVYWIRQPSEGGNATTEDSVLNSASINMMSAQAVLTSKGRFNAGLSISGKYVCAMPRHDTTSGVYYVMTAIVDGQKVQEQCLPKSYKPIFATFIDGRFAFGIDANYNYGLGTDNIGTYYPISDKQYLRLIRSPYTAPGMCKGWFFSKSGSRTVFVDIKNKKYFTIPAPGGCEDQGDYSLQLGDVSDIYNYSTTPIEDENRNILNRVVNIRRFILNPV
ncbi:MAG: hypothetical protein MJ189_00105 [Coriobacteriales bacterium]|nr:hypothetical protein [Coriobacteriales bacterium]